MILSFLFEFEFTTSFDILYIFRDTGYGLWIYLF